MFCRWDGEAPQRAEYAEEQVRGDDEAHVECPAPAVARGSGVYAYLRVSIDGAAADRFSEPPGVPLVFFDAQRKPNLYRHADDSEYGMYIQVQVQVIR